ncbi:MAG TPA: Na+/H+ antiporter NhaC family protein, partial [Candidatus Ozemobacteraceae bacterium]|nr:Na+/H+ antiporter NhaC family protein [Candidatus Ozemobacteraceae bacterium]
MTHFGLISLLPAAVTILVAVVSQRIVLAIFLGIVAGSLGATAGAWDPAWVKVEQYLSVSFQDLERLKIAAFVIMMGALVEVIARSGAYLKLSEAFRRFLNTPRKGRLASIGLGGIVFFDDYANLLISGTSMRGLGTALRISPGLHGYLVDQLATVVSLMFISTWAAYEGSLMTGAAEMVGLKSTPTQMLVDSLPYHVFTILGLFLALVVAWEGRWFGAAFDAEPDKAVRPVNVVGVGARLWHGLLPLMTLVGVTVWGVYTLAMEAQIKLGPAATWVNLLAEVPTINVLLFATAAGHMVALLTLVPSAVLMPFQYRKAIFEGCCHMIPAGLVIILAKGLSLVAGDLGTGTYITELLKGLAVPAVVPALVFVVSFLISVATGFSWSSMAIVMPVAYQMAMGVGGASMIP